MEAATRGDGASGEEVTQNVRTLHALPLRLTGVSAAVLEVRGEIYLRRDDFERLNQRQRALGEKITQHCVEMLDLMALANATQRETRASHIDLLLTRQRTITVLLRVSHDARYISPKLWADSIELLGSIGKQAGGWLKTANRAPAL